MNKDMGALGNIPQDGMQKASGDLMMNLEQLMNIVGPMNVEPAIRDMIASDNEVKRIQGMMLMEELKEAVGDGL